MKYKILNIIIVGCLLILSTSALLTTATDLNNFSNKTTVTISGYAYQCSEENELEEIRRIPYADVSIKIFLNNADDMVFYKGKTDHNGEYSFSKNISLEQIVDSSIAGIISITKPGFESYNYEVYLSKDEIIETPNMNTNLPMKDVSPGAHGQIIGNLTGVIPYLEEIKTKNWEYTLDLTVFFIPKNLGEKRYIDELKIDQEKDYNLDFDINCIQPRKGKLKIRGYIQYIGEDESDEDDIFAEFDKTIEKKLDTTESHETLIPLDLGHVSSDKSKIREVFNEDILNTHLLLKFLSRFKIVQKILEI